MCRIHYGFTEEEFFDLTPVQFSYLSEEFDERRRSEDFRAGVIASTIANCHRGKNGKKYKPSDFMPDYEKAQKKKRSKSPAEMKAHVQLINAMLGGTVNNKKLE